MNSKHDPANVTFDAYDCEEWFKKGKESADILPTPPLEGNEEKVKERVGMKILTPNKQLTKIPVLLALIKAENDSYKTKKRNQMNCVSTLSTQQNQQSFLQFNKVVITMRATVKDNKLLITTEPKTIHFDLPRCWQKFEA